ncbi:right-handed parallel beta-helix repeat-containing protein [Pantoea sp. UYEF8]|uniref:right-handed parallel beta-helix repeat-containing protein n=1 Tax=Pantoea sp. UYEF8 TaxID=1756394 RepID=UPI00339B079D
MSISDTAQAKKYSSVAEVAAAQAKKYALELETAPNYAAEAQASAEAAASSSQSASQFASNASASAASSQQSANSAATSAQDAAAAAGDAINQTVRAPAGETLTELPDAASRSNSFIVTGNDGDVSILSRDSVPVLDGGGKLPVSVIPSIALTEPFVVSDEAAMLALDAQPGDIAKRTDLGYSFCLAASPTSTLSNWIQLTDDVLSQLGQPSGATQVGATSPSGSSSTVQAELNVKAKAGANSDISSLSGLTTPLSSSQGGTGSCALMETLNDAASSSINATVNYIITNGYRAAGDGGGATYIRVTSQPSHPGKFQSADGAWWEITGTLLNPNQFGAAGDGVTDDAAAVAACVGVGRNVCFRGYSYLMNTYTIIPVAGQKFYGPGKLLKTNLTSDEDVSAVQDGPKFFKVTVDDFLLDGVEINYVNASSNSRVYGVTTQECTRPTIQNCKFTGQVSACFWWRGTTWAKFINNDCRAFGVFGIATGGDKDGNTNGLVTDWIISNNFFTGAISEAIDINWDSVRGVISDNVIRGNNVTAGEEEIDIGGGSCAEITVTGNIIDGGGFASAGITIKLNARYIVVANNVIRNLVTTNTDGHGIRLSYGANRCHILGNTINTAYSGVRFDRGASDNIVENNTILSTASSAVTMTTLNTTYPDFFRNHIMNNTILNCGSLGVPAVYINIGSDHRVCGNHIQGSIDTAVTIDGVGYCDISGNKISGSGNHGINTNGSFIKILGNTVANSQGHGVIVSGIYNNVQGNQLISNGKGGVNVWGIVLNTGADGANITGNTVNDPAGTKTQNGLRVNGAADRCILACNIIYGNVTNITGAGNLTNSVYLNNITS